MSMIQVNKNVPNITLDDVAGRDHLKNIIRGIFYNDNETIDEPVGIGMTGAYLLVGPSGSGKTYISHAMAGEFHKQKYTYICCSINKEGAFPEGFSNCVLNELETSNTFLLIKNIERLDDSDELYSLLQEAEKSRAALVVAAAAKNVNEMNLEVGMLFTYIYTDLPNAEQRETFFQKVMQGEETHVIKSMAEKTDGYGYNQLESLAAAVKLTVKAECEKAEVSGDVYKEVFEKTVDMLLQNYLPVQPTCISVPNMRTVSESVVKKNEETKSAWSEDKWLNTVTDFSYDKAVAALEEETKRQEDMVKKSMEKYANATSASDFPNPADMNF